MKRGFSLVEVLVYLGLMAALLLVVGDLARDFGRFSRWGDRATRQVLAARQALALAAREARQARVVTPLTGTTGARLELDIPPEVGRLPDFPLPEVAPPGWDPRGPALRIVYEVDGSGNLLRRVGGQQQFLAEQITGFSAAQPRTGLLHLTLSYPTSSGLSSAHKSTFLPLAGAQ